jgi:bifunctional non-homologous end joining protein LigD
MSNNVIESVELRYQEGTSDKVYRASVERSGGGYVVNFAYGRRGSALNTGTKTESPMPLAGAEAVYRKLVQSKTSKGYRVYNGGGERAIAVADNAGRDTGLRPQLPNAVTEAEASACIRADIWCAQEKYDGRRLLLRKAGDGTVTAANRKGLAVACPEPVAQALLGVRGPFTVDGELVGDRLHAFDLLESPAGDLRLSVYGERLSALESLLGRCTGTAFEVAPTVFGASAKKAFVDALRSAGKEGAVFKDLYATWTEGKMASGGPALKLKFWETCSCVVLHVNTGRRSVELALGGRPVGNVTIPPNFDVPSPGQVVEVRYLYVAGVGGSLYQPVYLGERDDIEPGECTAEAQNLKYKAAA